MSDEHLSPSVEECRAQGLDPAEFYWPWNGLRPDGKLYSMDPTTWVTWAMAMHPEYVDVETGMPLVYDFVFTQADEDLMSVDGLAGTVMVTILPMLDKITSYWTVAKKAADRYPANPKVAERFTKLSEMFLDKGM